jgi:quinohemoprotein ethanol dehydrogenase
MRIRKNSLSVMTCFRVSLTFVLLSALPVARSAPPVVQRDSPDLSRQAGNVDTRRVLAEDAIGQNWLLNGRDFGSSHFSPLRQITDKNVHELGLAWSLDIDSPMGLASEPIVVDGTIYIPATLDVVYAIDAVSGRIKWTYDPHVRLDETIWGSYAARIPRGVAVWNGKVFIGTGDCRVIALDAASGHSIWQTQICDSVQTGITGAPRVGGGKVYVGYFGSDTGTRGSLVALDVNTGTIAWRFWNVPGNPAKGFENPALALAAKTWEGKDWWQAGGGASWDPIVYDPKTGLVIYGTAGPGNGLRYGVNTEGDRLFSNCVIAVRASTGDYVWHYQTSKLNPKPLSPENFHIIVTDLKIRGIKRHVAMTVPRWGAFIVLDATSGRLISWRSLADRPSELRSPQADDGRARSETGKNWWPMSYDPETGLAYVPVFDHIAASTHDLFSEAVGKLIAWDPISQSARWAVTQPLAINGGVLSTAGKLVFQGEGSGQFSAYSAETGQRLWNIDTGSAIQGVPVTFTLQHRQFVLVPVGLGGGVRLFGQTSVMATPRTKRGPSRLLAFALNAKVPFPVPPDVVPAVPKPPVETASQSQIERGREVLDKYMCWGCHGGQTLDGAGGWVLNGAVPDLRYMPQDVHDQFMGIVLGGSRRKYGMPGFGDGYTNWPMGDQMSAEEAEALHAYIVHQEWTAYRQDQQRPARSTSSPN